MAAAIQDSCNEIWKPVVGWESVYEVSSLGRIRTIPRYVFDSVRKCTRWLPSRPIHLHTSPHGYQRVTLHSPARGVLVHRVVLEAFAGQPAAGEQACHNNGIRADNRIENLRWDTRLNNEADKLIHGTLLRGEDAAMALLTESAVKSIRALSEKGVRGVELARRFHVHPNTIYSVLRRDSWRHVA